MSWEELRKKSYGRGGTFPREWSERPCVAIRKTVVVFNGKFSELFANGKLKAVYVLYDDGRRCLGFKVASEDQIENDRGWYQVVSSQVRKGKTSGRNKSKYLNIERITKKYFSDCIGGVYRAQLNPEHRIIEVSLSPENLAK